MMKMTIRQYKTNFSFYNKLVILPVFVIFAMLLASCENNHKQAIEANRTASIFPEYYGSTLPPNIAPLNFIIKEPGSKFRVEISGESGKSIIISQSSSKIKIPMNDWHKLLNANTGRTINIDVLSFDDKKWNKYRSIKHQISTYPIDPVLVYRIVNATYLKWNKMGIYQRDLTNFEESSIIENNSTDGGCVNCHTFSKNNPSKMAMHFRIIHPGTMIWNNGKLTKTNTKTDETMSAGIYPAWHPDGIHIAFSTGKISPHLTTRSNKPVDVADKASGLFIYNTEKNTITTSAEISTTRRESMPEWSANGKYLYFVSAPEALKGDQESLLHNRYSLMRIAYDPATEKLGKAEMVINADTIGKSISMPAASPDGKFMVCALTDFGYFTIFHQNSDLYLINLETNELKKMELNSSTAESHSSWSSNGRWIVFSSKRNDGVLTRPYISFIDSTGTAHPPFLLPQEDPEMYDLLQANYNRPDLVTGKVELSPIEIRNLVMGEAQNVEVEK
jgi:hypothetical protein